MDEFRRIKLGCELSEHITSMWMAEPEKIETLDFVMVMCQAISGQIVGAAKDLNDDPVRIANVIHEGTLKFIEKWKKQ